MSNYAHGRPAQPHIHNLQAMFHKVEREFADGYVEVELEGLTAKRLLCIYAVAAQTVWQRSLQNMRSLFRLHPAH